VWRRLRELGLVRVFGRGPAALVAGSAVNWLIDQARESRQPERLDTARLVPGETYLVTTRPGMNRAERRDSKKLRASSAKLTLNRESHLVDPQRHPRARRRRARRRRRDRDPPRHLRLGVTVNPSRLKCRVCRQPAIIDLPTPQRNFCAEHFLELCRARSPRRSPTSTC
jgi:hypothetical protein